MRLLAVLALWTTACSLDLDALRRGDSDAGRPDADAALDRDADAGDRPRDADADAITDADVITDADARPDADDGSDADADGPPPTMCEADLDGDEDVDADDFEIYRLASGANRGEPSYNADADFDDDGTINAGDLNVMRSHLPSIEYALPSCEPERCAYDLVVDGRIDRLDVAAILAASGSMRGGAGYDPHLDFDASTRIDTVDVGAVRARVDTTFETDCTPTSTGMCPFDLSGDGDVDASDRRAFQAVFPAMMTDADYDARLDFDLDGDIDTTDLFRLAERYGTSGYTWPSCPIAPLSCVADLDQDNDVDGADIFMFSQALGSMEGEADYIIRIDNNSDGVISLLDYGTFWMSYGSLAFPTCTDPHRCLGDVDADLDVDADDLTVLNTLVGTDVADATYRAMGDIDGDGDIDADDPPLHMTLTRAACP